MYRRRKHITNFLHSWSAGSLLFFSGIVLYSSSGRDDVFKSLWPAWTFSEFGQVLNYNGDTLEQSSSLLQVLVIGGLHRITGGDIVLLGGLLAILFGMGTVMFSQLLAQDLGLSLRNVRWTSWLVAGSSFLVYWSWGGLDASLAALCMVLWAVALVRFSRGKKPWGLIVATAAFVLVRPENLFIGVLGIGGLGLYAWRTNCQDWPWKRLRNALSILLGLGTALLLLRWWVFGTALPHTVLAKGGGWGPGKIYRGMSYWAWEMIRHPEFLLLVLGCGAGLVVAIRRGAAGKLLLPLALAGASGVFVVVSGGDWMENGRFFVPMIALLVIVLLGAWESARETHSAWVRWMPMLLMLVNGFGLLHTARYHSTGQPLGLETGIAPGGAGFSYFEIANRIHMRDLRISRSLSALVGDLQKEKQAPVTIMSQQAGMVIFHTAHRHFRQFHFIDLVGLCTPDFLDCPVTRDRGGTYGGLNMDLFYLFSDYGRIHAECGFEYPDIIFDLDSERGEKQTLLSENGYVIVFRQTGQVGGWQARLPGMYVGAYQFIALRADWQEKLRQELKEVEFR